MSGTPLRTQYLAIKRRHPDAILLFRIGDFYEAFDEDARTVARELGIVLTSKPMGKDVRVPLAGVPHHSLERYLSRLIARGHRVAICEQLTDAPVKDGAGRGLIERDVVRVVTPGTIIEPGLLRSKINNYLAAYTTDGHRAGLAYADVTTGEFAATEIDAPSALTELQRIAPAELLVARSLAAGDKTLPGFLTRCSDDYFAPQLAKSAVLNHFGARGLGAFGLTKWPLATAAAGAIISYLRDTQTTAAGQLTRLTSYHTGNYMLLDAHTLRSLEVFESTGGAPSLLATLDLTRTAMGGRRLRQWLRQPLLDLAEIARRHEHVAWLLAHAEGRAEFFAALELVHDLERLSGRARASVASPQEVLALCQGLEAIPRVRAVLQQDTSRFGAALTALPTCEATVKTIRAALREELPRRTDGVNIIRAGYSEELDRLRELLRSGKTYLTEMEQRERARTGIKSLRVGFNKVFGHYIEVTKPNLHLVPTSYTRKQTLTNAERFITLELKEHESLVTNAQDRIAELEASVFRQVCAEIGKRRDEILAAAATIAYLDAVASFAEVSARHNYVRPTVTDTATLRIGAGRHPVLERATTEGQFIANDVQLGGADAAEIALITGPNMSGKCVANDTLVFTERGLMSLADLSPEGAVMGKFAELNCQLRGLNGRSLATHFYTGGKQSTVKLTTRLGFYLEGTPEHRVWTRDAQGREGWKRLGKIRTGDVIAIETKNDLWGCATAIDRTAAEALRNVRRYRLPFALDADLAYLLGLLVGDGTLTYRQAFTLSTADKFIATEFARIIERHFGYQVKRKANRIDYFVTSQQIRVFLASLGLSYYQAQQKHIPKSILRAPKPLVIAFLQGLFDADGYADKRYGNLLYATASRKLAREVQMLLLNLGIVASLHVKQTRAKPSYQLAINGAHAIAFHRQVGFRLPRKRARRLLTSELRRPNIGSIPFLANVLKRVQTAIVATSDKPVALKRDKSINSIFYTYLPNGRNISYSKLDELISYCQHNGVSCPELESLQQKRYLYEPVVAVETGESDVCDLSVAGDHAYIANGFVSHNSTYLRQTALIVLMAQVGSFVPAREASIGLCDRIFTRIGLYDRIGSGESTFMTEMVETAQILHHATPRSLILLDELGRGTSTYDGLAVARAVLEYIHNHPQLRAKTLFATHYHELTALAAVLPRVENLRVEIAEEGDELRFLYKITPGTAEHSYGVYAAKLAGLPRPVVRRAEELLREYEAKSDMRPAAEAEPLAALRPAPAHDAPLTSALLELDLNTLSPVEALMKLYELRRLAAGEVEDEANARTLRRA